MASRSLLFCAVMDWQNIAEDAVTRYIPDAEVRELVLAALRGARAVRRPAPAPGPAHLPGRARGRAAGPFRGALARVSALVPARRSGGAAVARGGASRRCSTTCPSSCRPGRRCGARAGRRARRPCSPSTTRRRCSRAARRPDRGRRRSCATTTTTRTGSRRRAGDAPRRHAGARDERLPVGPARRRQRRGLAVALAFGGRHARGPRLRHHARRPLPARDLRHGRAGRATLARLPVHAPYNLTLADRQRPATV